MGMMIVRITAPFTERVQRAGTSGALARLFVTVLLWVCARVYVCVCVCMNNHPPIYSFHGTSFLRRAFFPERDTPLFVTCRISVQRAFPGEGCRGRCAPRPLGDWQQEGGRALLAWLYGQRSGAQRPVRTRHGLGFVTSRPHA